MDEITNVSQLTAEIVLLKNQTAQNIIEIGKRLIQVKEQLPHGEWGKWLEEKVDFKQTTATKFMRVANEFSNLHTYESLNQSKIFALLDIPQDQREDFIQSNPIDEMTTRQLQQAIREKKELERQLEQEKRKPPVIKEKVVMPNDYEKIKRENQSFNKRLSETQRSIERLEQEKTLLERKVKLNEKEAQEYKSLKDGIMKLKQEKDHISREIEAATELSKYVIRIDKFLSEELAPVKYSRAIEECSNDPIVVKNLKEIIERVEKWVTEVKDCLPRKNDIEIMEVSYYE